MRNGVGNEQFLLSVEACDSTRLADACSAASESASFDFGDGITLCVHHIGISHYDFHVNCKQSLLNTRFDSLLREYFGSLSFYVLGETGTGSSLK
jgi:hypothetical protein